MSLVHVPAASAFAAFAARTPVPDPAIARALRAVLDTVGVMLAGSIEPAARAVRDVIAEEGGAARCAVYGTGMRASATFAALANGTATHALDYDDMCFASLAHPSAALVPAALAAAELAGASGRALLEGYVIGFEIEAALGRTMNPAHYERGWHCTSTIGTVGAAAACARILDQDTDLAVRTLAVAASSAAGLKENFGTMTKPLHAGLAAQHGILAALLAKSGITASSQAIDGPQGFLVAMASARSDARDAIEDLGRRWEILETGISVKLYPSCAGTHPAIDALLDLRREHGFAAGDIDRVDVFVDRVTPTVLIYERPATGLEGKFSMPFCAAAALAHGEVGLETFEAAGVADPVTRALVPRVRMQVDPALGEGAPPLTQARVRVALNDGRTFDRVANGARGYPERPASDAELETKFRTCASRVLPAARVDGALEVLRELDRIRDVRQIVPVLA
jgi:2-methylcitrate dehydratase PrpD